MVASDLWKACGPGSSVQGGAVGPQNIGRTACGTGGTCHVTELLQDPWETGPHLIEPTAVCCEMHLSVTPRKNALGYKCKTLD